MSIFNSHKRCPDCGNINHKENMVRVSKLIHWLLQPIGFIIALGMFIKFIWEEIWITQKQ